MCCDSQIIEREREIEFVRTVPCYFHGFPCKGAAHPFFQLSLVIISCSTCNLVLGMALGSLYDRSYSTSLIRLSFKARMIGVPALPTLFALLYVSSFILALSCVVSMRNYFLCLSIRNYQLSLRFARLVSGPQYLPTFRLLSN